MIASAWDWYRAHPGGYVHQSPEAPPGALTY
jgi:hypothetical protein